MSFGLSWRCSECNHSNMMIGWKVKRELKEELENGIEVQCVVCEEEVLDENNAVIIKED